MNRKVIRPKPGVKAVLRTLGKSIRMARQRRGLSVDEVADRADVMSMVVLAVEKGEANVTMGAYANILFALGLHEDLLSVASDSKIQSRPEDRKGLPRTKKQKIRRSLF